MKTVLTALASLALAMHASASIIPFDLQGTAGFGMLGGNEFPAVAGGGSGGEIGSGIFYDDFSKILTLNVGWGSGNGFTNLMGTVTAAHIHGPTASTGTAAFAENAGVLFSLGGSTPGFNSSGTNGGWTNTTATLSAAQETNLFNGQLYLNAHTPTNPGGEIRGQLVAAPEPSSAVLAALGLAGLASRRRIRRR